MRLFPYKYGLTDVFSDEQVVICLRRDLRSMCDADDLSALRRLLQLFTDAPCRQTGDPGVDLIIDHSADIIFIR